MLKPQRWPHLLSAAAMVCFVACASTRVGEASPPPPERGYPGALIDPSRIGSAHGGDFVTRQVITGAYGLETFRFEVVLQKQRDSVTVIGLTPMGTRAFVLQQRKTIVTFDQVFPGRAPFPPRYMLQDIHRAFFWQAWQAFAEERPADGQRTVAWQGETVKETWRGGRLLERRFARNTPGLCGEIVVRYADGWQLGEPLPPVDLDNAWFGYRLHLEHVDFRRL